MGRRLREWLVRAWATLRRRRSDADLAAELRLHLELAAEDAGRRGAPTGLRGRLGSLDSALDAQRDQRGLPWLEDIGRDLRYAVRTLRRAPGFASVAVLSLAVGIGANSAMFTLIDAVLFRTMPVDQPHRLFFIGHDPGPNLALSSNYPIFERYRAAPGFSGVTAFRTGTVRLRTAEGIERVAGQYVSGNYHAVVGVPMALGRGFASEPDRQPGASMLAVISHEYWMTRLGGSPAVIGATLTVADRPVTIVGVTARGFKGLSPGAPVHITLPMSVMALDDRRFFDAHDGWIGLTIVGRLAAGVSEAEATVAADAVFQQFISEPVNGWVKVANRDRFLAAALVPAARGTFALRRQYAQPLWMLLAMVGVLLLVACANVASLLLARAADRRSEIAVRLSIGAGRSRLVRQLLTESAVLAALGGLAGILLAVWSTGAILSVFAIGPSPVAIDATLNRHVLAATLAIVFLTTIGVGLVPAFRSTRVDLAPSLKDGAAAVHGGPRPTVGRTLVVAQVALSLVLVSAAALLARSLDNFHRLDAGFSRDHIVLADIDLAAARFTTDQRERAFADLLARLRTLPGVQSASFSSRTPIDFSSALRRIEVPGFEANPRNGVSPNDVTPGYFQTFGLGIVRGRDFTVDDRRESPPVAVISRAMARHFFGDGDPIGRTFVLAPSDRPTTIVGVVEDARHENLRTDSPARMVYLPLTQSGVRANGNFLIQNSLAVALRTTAAPASVAASLRRELRTITADAMVLYVRTMEQQVDATLIPERLVATLSAWFAAVALLLACVGLYGVIAYNVARRKREIGLRIALGAIPGAILRHVFREALLIAAVGIVIGLPLALAALRLLQTLLFDLAPYDLPALAASVGALLLVALVAGILPARRAATTDPVEALRDR